MAIQLHSAIISGKRYVQVATQPHYIAGILKNILHSQTLRRCNLSDIYSASYESVEDGTITFYQGSMPGGGCPGIWSYLAYDCPEGEEKVFPESSFDTSVNLLQELFSGNKLVKETINITEYLQSRYTDDEYFDVLLPWKWEKLVGREIVDILFKEYQGLKSSLIFAEGAGKKYMNAILDTFIQAGEEVLANNGTVEDFEHLQYAMLHTININDVANSIIEYNDYRLWQEAMPSNSKAVEHVFNSSLNIISKMKY